MEFIQKRAVLFNKLVLDSFIKNYELSVTKLLYKLNIRNHKLIYVKSNHVIVHNKIINIHYNLNLDETKYTLIMILYKNIKYKEINSNNVIDIRTLPTNITRTLPITNTSFAIGTAILNSDIKKNIYKIFRNLDQKRVASNIMIIGRKYKTDNKIIPNAFECYCTFNILKIKDKNKVVKKDSVTNSITNSTQANLRRTFILNLKKYINQYETEINTFYINNLIHNSVFLDVEYTNDIYDDFSTFPISKDTSMLFIIGVLRIVKNQSFYTDFTSKRLTYQEEYKILDNFLDYISNQNDKNNKFPVTVFHWSHADKYIIEKSLSRYPDLQEKYNSKQIIYIDLLIVLKQTITLPSYSLKYVAKELLNLHYDTDCQNGLDAMCSIIQNDIMLTNQKSTSKQDLLSLQSSKDIIKYNKIDTTLLYNVLIHFIKNATLQN
jgi:hypothetical protein